MTDLKDTITKNAIAANLAALRERLSIAERLAFQACKAMDEGEQNQAIGTILDFKQLLPEALALFDAAIALHQGKR